MPNTILVSRDGAVGVVQLNRPQVLNALNEILPSDATVVEETITHRSALDRHLDRVKSGHFFSGAIGGLGTGFGTALGVKCAVHQGPVILLIGRPCSRQRASPHV